MTGATLFECGSERIDDVMGIMTDAFDPAFGEAWTASQCSGMLVLPGVWMTLAVEGEAASGFSVARVVADEAELLLLGVRRAHWRRGVGLRLLDRFCETAAQRGARRLHLEMREGNAAAHMYAAAGFEQVGRRRNYYRGLEGKHHDAITLARATNANLL